MVTCAGVGAEAKPLNIIHGWRGDNLNGFPPEVLCIKPNPV